MMAWYVFALTDTAPAGRPVRGLRAPVSFRRMGGVFAAVERRADVPPPALGSLRRHQQVVDRLAARVPAILPVRFGTLLEARELREAVQTRQEDFEDALALVRDSVQFTWRAAQASSPSTVQADARSGTEYLLRLAISGREGALRAIPKALRPLVVGERQQPATGALPAATYHLVRKRNAEAYVRAARHERARKRTLTFSGPWPPYAFTPALV